MRAPRHARLLGAALMGDPRMAAGLAALDAAGWSALLREAGEDLLTPELAAPLATPALAAVVPCAVAGHLAALRALNAARNARIAAQAAEMLPAFAAAGLCPLLLKGMRGLADPDPGRADRVTGDLDLLFPRQELAAAAAVLERLGYRRLAEDGPSVHAAGCFARAGEPASVDLHRAALRLPHLLPALALLARARHAVACGAPVLLADPADEVLHRALHAMLHHRAYRLGLVSLRHLRDIAVRLPALTPGDWDWLRARSAGRARAPLATALRLAGVLFGPTALPAPGAALARHPLARLAAWRVLAKCRDALPHPVDEAWGKALGCLGAHEHRPDLDGPVLLWRARRFVGSAASVTARPGGAAPRPVRPGAGG